MKKNPSLITLPNASWAHKAGISKESNGSPGFGLNPNLNIEDEYIENLLKQIHFMTMEIKLLKQKQQQSSGNSLWGVINRANEPLVKNIVDSNQKYQTMKKQIDTNVNKTQYDNIRLADQQHAILKKMGFLEKKIQLLQTNKKQSQNSAKLRQEKIKQKINQHQGKLKGVIYQKQQQIKKGQQLSDQYQAILTDVEKQKFYNHNQLSRIKNDEEIQQMLLNDKIKDIQSLKSKIQLIKQSIESSQEYQRAKQDQAHIRQNMGKIGKNIASAEFQLLQINQTIKLAEKQKERQVIERKKYMEQYESLKLILKQIKTLNQTRINQEIINRRRESTDIQKGQYQTKKLQKNLQEIKKKLLRSEESQKSLKQEVEHMQRELLKLKTKRDQVSQFLSKLTTENDKQETVLSSCRNQYRKVNDQYQKIVNTELNSNCDLNDIETEIMYLRERKQFLSQALNLKQTLNQTKIQQLQKLVQKNKDVNQTVGVLMEKWEQIRCFSKM